MKNYTKELKNLISEAENTIVSYIRENGTPDGRGGYYVFLEGVDHWTLTTDMEEDHVLYKPSSMSIIGTETGWDLYITGTVPGTFRRYDFHSIEVPVHLIMEIADAMS